MMVAVVDAEDITNVLLAKRGAVNEDFTTMGQVEVCQDATIPKDVPRCFRTPALTKTGQLVKMSWHGA